MANSKADKYDMFKEFEEAIRKSKALSEKQLNNDSKSPFPNKPVPAQPVKTATKANGKQPRADASKSPQVKSSVSAPLSKTGTVTKAGSSGKLKWILGMLVAAPIYMIHSWYTSAQEAEQEWTQQKKTVTDAFNSVEKSVKEGNVEELKLALPKIHEVSASVKVSEEARENYEENVLDCWTYKHGYHSPTLEECFIGELFDVATVSSNGEAMKLLYETSPQTIDYRIKEYNKSGRDSIFSTVMNNAEPSTAKWNLGSLLMKKGANPDPAGTGRDMVKYIRAQNPPDDFIKQVEEQAAKHILDENGHGISLRGKRYLEDRLGITDIKFNYDTYLSTSGGITSWGLTGKKGKETGAGRFASGIEVDIHSKDKPPGAWFETLTKAKSEMKKDMKEEDRLTRIEFLGKAKKQAANEECGSYFLALNFKAQRDGKPVTGIACRKSGYSEGYTETYWEFTGKSRTNYKADEPVYDANEADEEHVPDVNRDRGISKKESSDNAEEPDDEPAPVAHEGMDANLFIDVLKHMAGITSEEPDDKPAPVASEGRSSGGDYDLYIRKAAAKYGVDANLIRAVMITESAGRPEAVSPKGAQGLMQLMPETARRYGVRDSFDPEQNINGGTKYLRFLFNHYSGETKLILAAYNAGEKAVDEYGGIPPYQETIQYVKRVQRELGRLLKLNSQNR